MSIKAVMYHYVRPRSVDVPGLRYLGLENFQRQLNWICDQGEILPRKDFEEIILGNMPIRNGFVLTFDDGLLDHYEFVFPELQKRNLWGAFYVSTGPFVNQKILDVHVVHILLGIHGGSKVLKKLFSAAVDLNIHIPTLSSKSNSTYLQNSDAEDIVMVKKLINYEIEPANRSLLLNALCQELPIPFEVENWYLSPSQIGEMASAGMLIGSHSVSHSVMSSLDLNLQDYEIYKSISWLDKLIGPIAFRSFAYPYGGDHTFSEDTEKILKKHNFELAFSVDNKEIKQSDVRTKPFSLPRIDCANLSFGSAEKFYVQ